MASLIATDREALPRVLTSGATNVATDGNTNTGPRATKVSAERPVPEGESGGRRCERLSRQHPPQDMESGCNHRHRGNGTQEGWVSVEGPCAGVGQQ